MGTWKDGSWVDDMLFLVIMVVKWPLRYVTREIKWS